MEGQPGYATFSATARWILDPADPANFASKLATKRFLIQEVVGDTVVPNIATERLAALDGRGAKAAAADPYNAGSPTPSAAITTPTPTENKFLSTRPTPADELRALVAASVAAPTATGDRERLRHRCACRPTPPRSSSPNK